MIKGRVTRARLAEQLGCGGPYSVCDFDEEESVLAHLQEHGTAIRLDDGRLSRAWAREREDLLAAGFTHLLFCWEGGGRYVVRVVVRIEEG